MAWLLVARGCDWKHCLQQAFSMHACVQHTAAHNPQATHNRADATTDYSSNLSTPTRPNRPAAHASLGELEHGLAHGRPDLNDAVRQVGRLNLVHRVGGRVVHLAVGLPHQLR